MRLWDLAHCRSGDKGDTSTVSVFAYDPADYPLLLAWVTPERVRAHLAALVQGEVRRYELPQLAALHFVLENALGGGVTRSLRMDRHGKSIGMLLLGMEIPPSG